MFLGSSHQSMVLSFSKLGFRHGGPIGPALHSRNRRSASRRSPCTPKRRPRYSHWPRTSHRLSVPERGGIHDSVTTFLGSGIFRLKTNSSRAFQICHIIVAINSRGGSGARWFRCLFGRRGKRNQVSSQQTS
ncbi:hypothetical protein NL676_024762 [Syzygium grande]|nr:hypothetical protein NL676_024762 [Syzygium grande]